MQDPLLQLWVPAVAEVPGVDAIVLGGSRARGTATENSDYDFGLYYSAATQLDTDRLREAMIKLVDKPGAAEVTPVGEWGPWIVGVPGYRSPGERSICFIEAATPWRR